MTAKPRIHQWEQQPDEPQGAFEQFLLYLNQPRGERQVKESYLLWMERQTGTRPVPGQPPGSYYEIAEKYQWKDRVRAHDREADRKVYAKIEAKRANGLMAAIELGSVYRERAGAAARMISPVTQTIGERDGMPVVLVEVKMTPAEITRMGQVGIELEQLGYGNPTSRIELTGNADAPLMLTVDNAKDELIRRIREVRSGESRQSRRRKTRHDEANLLRHVLAVGKIPAKKGPPVAQFVPFLVQPGR